MKPEPDNLAAELSAYLDGELPPEQARAVEARLAESAEARRELAELRAVAEQLHGLPRRKAPVDVADLLHRTPAKSEGSEAAAMRPARSGRRRWRILVLTPLASAAVLALVILWVNRPATERDLADEAVTRGRGAEPGAPMALEGTRLGDGEAAGRALVDVERVNKGLAAGDLYATADEAPAPDRDTFGAARRESGTPESAAMAGRMPRAAGGGGEVRQVALVVRPQSAEEYAAAVRVVESWPAWGLFEQTSTEAGDRAAGAELSDVVAEGDNVSWREYAVAAPLNELQAQYRRLASAVSPHQVQLQFYGYPPGEADARPPEPAAPAVRTPMAAAPGQGGGGPAAKAAAESAPVRGVYAKQAAESQAATEERLKRIATAPEADPNDEGLVVTSGDWLLSEEMSLLLGRAVLGMPLDANVPASAPADTTVRLQVVIVPPPGAASQPASAPAERE